MGTASLAHGGEVIRLIRRGSHAPDGILFLQLREAAIARRASPRSFSGLLRQRDVQV